MKGFRTFVPPWITAALVVVGVAVVAVPCFAGSGPEPRLSATGLETAGRSVGLLIEEIRDRDNKLGLSQDRVQAEVELRLRQAGVAPTEPLPGRPQLVVDIGVVGAAFAVALFVLRRVQFTDARGDAFAQVAGMTWHRRVLGTHGDSATQVIQGLNQLLDIFLNDYLQANPQ